MKYLVEENKTYSGGVYGSLYGGAHFQPMYGPGPSICPVLEMYTGFSASFGAVGVSVAASVTTKGDTGKHPEFYSNPPEGYIANEAWGRWNLTVVGSTPQYTPEYLVHVVFIWQPNYPDDMTWEEQEIYDDLYYKGDYIFPEFMDVQSHGCAFALSLDQTYDLYAERALPVITTDHIWEDNCGNGLELTQRDTIGYTGAGKEWYINGGILAGGEELDVATISGDLSGAAFTQPIVTLQANVYRNSSYTNQWSNTFADISYSFPRVSTISNTLVTSGYAGTPYRSDMDGGVWTFESGGGNFELRGQRNIEQWMTTTWGDILMIAQARLIDYCSSDVINPNCDLNYMWETTGKKGWSVIGNDTTTSGAAEINGGSISYGGYVEKSLSSVGDHEEYYSTDNSAVLSHCAYISGMENTLNDTITGGGDYWGQPRHFRNESTPEHGPWYPLPLSGYWLGGEGEPGAEWIEPEEGWHDGTCYLSNDYLTWDTSVLNFVRQSYFTGKLLSFIPESAPGNETVVPTGMWETSNCTITSGDDYYLHVATSGTDATISLPLSGALSLDYYVNTRLCNLTWIGDTPGAKISVRFGSHTWTDVCEIDGQQRDIIMDMLCPDETTKPYDKTFQSIIPKILPYEYEWDYVNHVPKRPDETTFDWDYPAGWGVGRLANFEIKFSKPGNYKIAGLMPFWDDSDDANGKLQVIVLPHQASWNDTRTLDDFAVHYAGTNVYGLTDEGETEKTRTYYEYIEAIVVLGGKIIAEIPGGCIWIDSHKPTYAPTYNHQEYNLSDTSFRYWRPNFMPPPWVERAYPEDARVVYQGDIYVANEATSGIPTGADWTKDNVWRAQLVTATTSTPARDAFQANNALYTGLVPGIYSDSTIGIKWKLYAYMISHPGYATEATNPYWNITKWRGNCAVFGNVFTGGAALSEGVLTIKTLDSSIGYETNNSIGTDKMGNYLFSSLNTKGKVLVGTGYGNLIYEPTNGQLKYKPETGELLYQEILYNNLLRNRMITFLNIYE